LSPFQRGTRGNATQGVDGSQGAPGSEAYPAGTFRQFSLNTTAGTPSPNAVRYFFA
jgi:hypothetical protein